MWNSVREDTFARNRVAVLLGTGIWILAVLLARNNYYTLFGGGGGLGSPADLFTPMLWLAILLTAIGVLLSGKDRMLPIFLVAVFVMFHFTLTLFQEDPRVYDSYSHFGRTEMILQTGYLSPAQIDYHSWPGAFLLASMLMRVAGVPSELFLYWFPLLSTCLVSIGLFLVARKLSTFSNAKSSKHLLAPLAGLVFLAENSSLQTHFSPQSLGFVMAIFFAYALLSYGCMRGQAVMWAALCFILFVGVTITHPPSSLLLVFALVVLFCLKGWRLFAWPEPPRLTLVVGLIAIFVAWQIYQVQGVAERIADFSMVFLALVLGGFRAVGELYVSTSANPFLSALSILRHFFFFAIGSFGFFLILKRRNAIFSTVFAYGVATALFFAFSVSFVGGLLWERTILFGSFPLALSAAYLIQNNRPRARRILSCCCLLFIIVSAYTIYGIERQNIVPVSELAVAYYTVNKVPTVSITAYTDAIIFYANPAYRLSMIRVVEPPGFVPIFIDPPSTVCQVIVSGQVRVLVGDQQFQDLSMQMENRMNLVYYSDFNTVLMSVQECG